MKAVRVHQFGNPPQFAVAETDLPVPAADQVEIQVHAAGINPVDSYVCWGGYEFYQPSLPFTPGVDAAGVVRRCGSAATDLSPGDRVYVATLGAKATGSYAETMVCDRSSVHRLPGRLSFAQGAAIGVPVLTAVRALVQRGAAQAGETVLVHGASGGVGLPTVQLAVALGLTVIGTAGTAAGMAAVKAAGATTVLNHREPDYLDAIAGTEPDLVVEMLASKNLQTDAELVRRSGRVVIVGSRGPSEIHPRTLMVGEVDVRGTAIWNMTPPETAEATVQIGELLEAGLMTPVVGRTFALDDVAVAVECLMSGATIGKVVLIP